MKLLITIINLYVKLQSSFALIGMRSVLRNMKKNVLSAVFFDTVTIKPSSVTTTLGLYAIRYENYVICFKYWLFTRLSFLSSSYFFSTQSQFLADSRNADKIYIISVRIFFLFWAIHHKNEILVNNPWAMLNHNILLQTLWYFYDTYFTTFGTLKISGLLEVLLNLLSVHRYLN